MNRDINNTIMFSVIIPVYNAEKTIGRCLNSILRQNHNNVEIILINDGSTDRSEEICKTNQLEDEQVVYIKKANGGVSSARNAGLEIARGEYITFVDSDDYVSPDYFISLKEAIAIDKPDWIHFSNILHRESKTIARVRKSIDLIDEESIENMISDMICRKTINGPCDKAYKKSIIDKFHLRFEESISIGEDWAFNVSYACLIKSFRAISEELYHVCEDRMDSLSRIPRTDLDHQIQRAVDVAVHSVDCCGRSTSFKLALINAIHFYELSRIYTEAKKMQRENISVFKRYRVLRKMCAEEMRKKRIYPKTNFCRLVVLLVKMRFILVIDWVAKEKMR